MDQRIDDVLQINQLKTRERPEDFSASFVTELSTCFSDPSIPHTTVQNEMLWTNRVLFKENFHSINYVAHDKQWVWTWRTAGGGGVFTWCLPGLWMYTHVTV